MATAATIPPQPQPTQTPNPQEAQPPQPQPQPPAGSELQQPTAAQIQLNSFVFPALPPEAASLRALTLTCDIKPTVYSDLLETDVRKAEAKAKEEAKEASSSRNGKNEEEKKEEEKTVTTTSSGDEYEENLNFPKNLESLTLELFSLGYAPSFLTRFLERLDRGLESLTLYSQLFDGVSDASRRDASEFGYRVLTGEYPRKKKVPALKELHVLDTFFRRGFVAGLGRVLEELHEQLTNPSKPLSEEEKRRISGLRFLEVSYTYRGHSDRKFLDHVPGDELPCMLVPSLIAASFSLSAPPSTKSSSNEEGLPDDPADVDENGQLIPGRKPEGIIPLPVDNKGVGILLRKLTAASDAGVEIVVKQKVSDEEKEDALPEPGSGPGPRDLRMLDVTLYTLKPDQLTRIVEAQKDLAVLSASVLVSAKEVEAAKKQLLDVLRNGKELEIVEIVGVPGDIGDQEVTCPYSSDLVLVLTYTRVSRPSLNLQNASVPSSQPQTTSRNCRPISPSLNHSR